MSIKKFATSSVVAASMLAANLAPFAATAASAKDWRRYNDDRGYSRSYDGPRYHNHYAYRRDRDRSGKNVAKGIAIGLGILAIGSILASAAHR